MPLALNKRKTARKGGLAFRMSFFILTSAACIFIAAFGYNYFYSRSQILADVERNSEIITVATVSKIEVVLNGVEIGGAALLFLFGLVFFLAQL